MVGTQLGGSQYDWLLNWDGPSVMGAQLGGSQ